MVEFIFSEKDLEGFIKEVEKDPGGKGIAEANSSGDPCMEKVDPEMEFAKIKNSVLVSNVIQLQDALEVRLKQIADLQTLVEKLEKTKGENEKELALWTERERAYKEAFHNYEVSKNQAFALENFLSEKNLEVSCLKNEISRLEAEIRKLNQKNGNLKKNITNLGKEYGQLKKELTQLKNAPQEKPEVDQETKEEEVNKE